MSGHRVLVSSKHMNAPIAVAEIGSVTPIHKAQLFSYMRLLDVPLGLVINFHETKLVDGLSRMILPQANR